MADTVYDNGCLDCEASCVGICCACSMAARGLTAGTGELEAQWPRVLKAIARKEADGVEIPEDR